MQAKREGREDCGAVARRFGAKGLFDMFEAAAGRDPVAGKERKLRRTVHEPFQRIEAIDRRNLADRVHSRVNIERRETFGAALDLSDALADLVSDWPE
jgi:hypothetical protein